MLNTIINYLVTAWNFFIHAMNGLRLVVVTTFGSLEILADVFAWLPSIIAGFVTLTILVLIVKLLLGRG